MELGTILLAVFLIPVVWFLGIVFLLLVAVGLVSTIDRHFYRRNRHRSERQKIGFGNDR